MKNSHLYLILLLSTFLAWSHGVSQDKPGKKQMKPVLIVMDIQNEFLTYVPESEKKIALETINDALMLFRQYNLPVIRVYHTEPQWGPQPGTEPFEFPKSIAIKEDDPLVIKNFPSAFKNTDLEKILREKECNTVFLCGLSAVGCVLATYFSAIELDFDTFMIRGGLMSHNSNYTDTVEEIFSAVNWNTVRIMLQYTQ